MSRVGEVNVHQFDALVVYHDRCSDGSFVDVLGVDNFLSPHPVQHNSNSVFVAPMNMCFWCNLQFSDLSDLQVSLFKIASHLQPSSSHTISSILSLECVDLIFCSTMNVVSFPFVFPLSWFFFSVVLPHRSLLLLVVLLLLSFFLLFETMLPLTIVSLLSFLLLLLLSLFSSSKLRKHSGTSPSTFRSLCLPPTFPFKSSFFSFCFHCRRFHASCKLQSPCPLV